MTETSPAWARYVTLCVGSEEGLEAVSESVVLSTLAHRTVPVQPWMRVGQLQGAGTAGGLDCSLLEAAGAWGSGSTSTAAEDGAAEGWRSLVAVGAGCVVVDVLAPGPIDSAAAVKVAVTSSQLTVTVDERGTPGNSSSNSGQRGSAGKGEAAAAGGKMVHAGEAVVVLPVGLFGDGCKLRSSTKLSRAMGLLSVKVTAE